MVQAEAIQADWNKMHGQIKKRWKELQGDDLRQFGTDVDALAAEIQRKTGESRQAVEAYLEYLNSKSASAVGRAAETVKQYGFAAAGALANGGLAEGIRRGYAGARQIIRPRRHKPDGQLARRIGCHGRQRHGWHRSRWRQSC